MITFSKEAKREILRILRSNDHLPDLRVRIGIKGNACEGTYIFGLDVANENDDIKEVDEIPIVIAKKHFMYVLGTQINVNLDGDKPIFSISND